MFATLSASDRGKFTAAAKAVEYVEDGMRLGLGTGSTAEWMVKHLAAKVKREGLQLRTVPTSERTAELARGLGLVVEDLDAVGELDLTIDGADEFDLGLNLIKGAGGALLREKIVATASARMIVIADPSKEVSQLGAFPLPVEVVPFGWATTQILIERALASLYDRPIPIALRKSGSVPYTTDEGNVILDLSLGQIANPDELNKLLNTIAGVVETGLFTNICDGVIIGRDGHGEVLEIGEGGVARSDFELTNAQRHALEG